MCVMWDGPDELDTSCSELPIPEGICANTWKGLTEQAAGQLTRRGKAIPWQILQEISWDHHSAPPFPIRPLLSHHPIPGCGCTNLAPPSENTRGGLLASHPGMPRAVAEELPSETFTVAHLCWKFTLELEWPPWSPTCLCQQWFQYIIIKLADGGLGGEGREKPIKCWLSVNVKEKVHQQK